MTQARLIVDPPALGAWNMAVDQALLETANQTGLVTLRFYQWAEPTLSLGYFQNHEDRSRHPASQTCPLVRRRTGGGAILHDQELTYSLCIPSQNRWATENSELYEAIHQIIIRLINDCGGEAALYRDSATEQMEESDSGLIRRHFVKKTQLGADVDQNSFMCFQRRSPGDVVSAGYKIVGSAQRRVQNALLQHGSILTEKSVFSPELPGIHDICGFRLNVAKTIEKLTSAVENRLQTNLIAGKLSPIEVDSVHQVCAAFFDNPRWNLRR